MPSPEGLPSPAPNPDSRPSPSEPSAPPKAPTPPLSPDPSKGAATGPAPLGFEAGTPPIAGVIGLGATLGYLASLDATAVAQHEANLHQHLLRGLADRDGIRILGTPQAALASFVVEGVHNADLAHVLTEQGIAVRAGHHCAMPLLKGLGLEGAIRVSLALYNDGDDLARFFDALDQGLELLR